jgi:hypothetical protein
MSATEFIFNSISNFYLNFQAPQKKKPWEGVLKAHFDSPLCIQRDPFRRDMEVEGSEDCLFLNVYAPEVVKEAVPVMVFFHGGGYMVSFLLPSTIQKISKRILLLVRQWHQALLRSRLPSRTRHHLHRR